MGLILRSPRGRPRRGAVKRRRPAPTGVLLDGSLGRIATAARRSMPKMYGELEERQHEEQGFEAVAIRDAADEPLRAGAVVGARRASREGSLRGVMPAVPAREAGAAGRLTAGPA